MNRVLINQSISYMVDNLLDKDFQKLKKQKQKMLA